MSSVKQIAIYGKGGIGKSTMCCNLSYAMTLAGETVLQIGCSPKTDSTSMLNGGDLIVPGILEHIRKNGISREQLLQCIRLSSDNVYCAETGGPEPAKGCAGKGVTTALDLMSKYRAVDEIGATVVIYDVIGDVVCGGFAKPMRSGFAEDIYIVTSGELMSLYSANNICIAIADAAGNGSKARVSGIIGNMRGVREEIEIIEQFGAKIGVPVTGFIPRDSFIQDCESNGTIVMKKYPESSVSKILKKISSMLLENKCRFVPNPLALEDLVDILKKYQASKKVFLKASA